MKRPKIIMECMPKLTAFKYIEIGQYFVTDEGILLRKIPIIVTDKGPYNVASIELFDLFLFLANDKFQIVNVQIIARIP